METGALECVQWRKALTAWVSPGGGCVLCLEIYQCIAA